MRNILREMPSSDLRSITNLETSQSSVGDFYLTHCTALFVNIFYSM